MPEPVQTADVSAALAREFRIQGRLPMALDEIIVPVVVVRDLTISTVAPPSFGKAPGTELAMGVWSAGGSFAGNITGGLRVRAGTSPVLIERIASPYIQSGDFVAVMAGPQGFGTLVLGGGSWGYRREGQPSLTVETIAVDAGAELLRNPLAVFAAWNQSGSQGWTELNIALQPSNTEDDEALTELLIVPIDALPAAYVAGSFTTAQAPSQDSGYYYALQWRE